MGLFSRIVLPSSAKRARRAAHPLSAVTPRSVRKVKMRGIDATHPIGASKRAGKRSLVRTARGGGGGSTAGYIAIAVIAALVFAAILAVLSIPGHLLHLTPSLAQVFGTHPPHYLHARYRNVVLGYVLVAVGLIAAVATLPRAATEPRSRPLWQFGIVVIVLVAVALVTATGERKHQLTVAQAAGVVIEPAQSHTLAIVAQRAVLTHVQDSTGSDDWIVVPGACSFANLSTNFLGTDYDFTCTAQAFNARRHRTPNFKAAITCANSKPTISGCTSDSEQDLTRLSGVKPVIGPVPAQVINRLAGPDLDLILRNCIGHVKSKSISTQQLSTAVEYDRLYQQYGSTPFRLAAGGPVLSMTKLLQEAAAAGHKCQPKLTMILTAALSTRHS